MKVQIVILTFNSADVIERTIGAAMQVSAHVGAVDSGSSDGTRDILSRLGVEVLERPFKNYSDQRNWAIAQFRERAPWQLHLDADEVLDERAIAELRRAAESPGDCSGFMLQRRMNFLGAPLRFGGTRSWHLRLFRAESGRCEDRLYDQHFLCDGKTRRLPGVLNDLNVGDLTEWTARHNRWASMEAAEMTDAAVAPSGDLLKGRMSTDPRQRRRFYKGAYYRAPQLIRPIAYFVMRYFLQLGFLDGRVGFFYAFFQAFWFRMLVDAKMWELSRARSTSRARVRS